ncbi:MAG: respiratory nitrate reductase subunit gamma [Thaumarchaeota archaeon]|nr:respiratory nitrate reductase subunit gamma [Nitrososphaerota archaeon]
MHSRMNNMFLSDVAPGSGTFPTFVSVSLIDLLATITLVIVIIGAAWKFTVWRRSSPPSFLHAARASLGSGGLVTIFFSELVNRVLLQKNVINEDRVRRFTHLSMFWGFIGLSVTTTLDYIFNRPGNYIPLFGTSLSTIRLLGNVSGAIMMLGATIAVGRLIAVPKFRRARTFGDVWFTSLLFIVGLTGYIAEYYGEVAYAANPSAPPAAVYSLSLSASPLIVVPYGVHLVAIGLLFLSAPVSAFIHVLQVPSMRYMDAVGSKLSAIRKQEKNELRKYKETAMLDQLQSFYEASTNPRETTENLESEKK